MNNMFYSRGKSGTAGCVCWMMMLIMFILSHPTVVWSLEVDCDVEAGYAGMIGNSGVFPVSVTIRNKTLGSQGLIEITQPDVMNGSEVRYVLPIVSPSPSVKKFDLLIRAEPDRDLNLQVSFKEDIKTLRKRIKVTRTPKPMVLCVGLPQGYRLGQTAGEYGFVNTSGQSIPINPVALGGVYGVMFSGAAFSKLNVPQLETIRQWTATGGRLIIVEKSGDADFNRNAGVVTADFSPGLHQFGSGLVAVADADAGPDAAFWEGNDRITSALFPPVDAKKALHHFGSGGGSLFSNLWQIRRTYGWWGFFWIVIILTAYIIVIGPLDKWLVKRKGRPILTWVLFPSSIAVFSVLAYGYSSMVNVGTMRAVYANVIDASPEQCVARVKSLLWVYSVKNDSYEITATGRDVFLSGRETSMKAGNTDVVICNGQNSLLQTRIPIFSGKSFDAEWFAPWLHNITYGRDRNDFKIIVPESLKVMAAFLAEETGMKTMQNGANKQEWIAEKRLILWADKIPEITKDLNRWNHNSLDDDGKKGGLPAQKVLENFLVSMSFPFETENKNNPYALYGRDGIEIAMDIRSRLKNGKCLLLFLAPSKSMMPVEVKGYWPEISIVNLVRIQIPNAK